MEYCGPVTTLDLGVRWFLSVRIGGVDLDTLVDTGSSVTLIGEKGRRIEQLVDREDDNVRNRPVILANGSVERIVSSAELPVEVAGRTKNLVVRLVPSIMGNAIVGMDFIRAFGVSLDGGRGTWRLADRPEDEYSFDPAGWIDQEAEPEWNL